MSKITILVVVIFGVFSSLARAAFLPYGVQSNVNINTVSNVWKWEEIYRGDYSHFNIPIEDVFAGHKSHIMLAAQLRGSSEYELLAAVAWEDFIIHTTQDETKSLNGAEWYYNGGGLGFAGLGDPILQVNCDLYNADSDRLCWHTQVEGDQFDYSQLPVYLDHGFRAGSYLDLNFGDTGWDRVVLTANVTAVPVAPSILFFISSLASIGAARKMKFNKFGYNRASR